jgi:hypothetical protein
VLKNGSVAKTPKLPPLPAKPRLSELLGTKTPATEPVKAKP